MLLDIFWYMFKALEKWQKKKRLEGQKALGDKMLHECFINLLTTF